MRIVKDLIKRMKENNPMKNPEIRKKVYTPERNKKISESKKGKKLSEEHIENIRKSHIGYKMPEEQRLKIVNNPNHIKTRFQKGHIGYTYWKNKKLNKNVIDSLIERRKNAVFPKQDTQIEVKIQEFLKQLNIEFYTHQYIKEIEHAYQVDILIPSMNLIIECDGNYWHNYPLRRDIDNIRTSELLEKGFKVLRLWGSEINEMQLEDFKIKICV